MFRKFLLLPLVFIGFLSGPSEADFRGFVDQAFPRALSGSETYREYEGCSGGASSAGADNWVGAFSGTGANVTAATATDLNDACAVKLDLGTVATNDSGIRTSVAAFDLGNGDLCVIGWIRDLVVSDDATVDFIARFGISSGDTAPSDFIGFRYNDNVNSGKWQTVSRSSGTDRTTADSGITFTANTSHWMKVCINAAGTSATLFAGTTFANMAQIGSAHTSSLPTGQMGVGYDLERTVGTAASSPAQINFMAFSWKPTTPRW